MTTTRVAALLLVLPALAGLLGRATASTGAADVAISTAARALQPGELVVVTVAVGGEPTQVAVGAFGRSAPAVRIADGLWQALVGIDLDQPAGAFPLTAEAHVAGAVPRDVQSLVVQPKQFGTRRLTVAPDFVNPPPAILARINREAALLRDVYARSDAQRLWRAPFVRPVAGAANAAFGVRSIFNGEPRRPHAGADFLSGAGTPIQAPSGGRIVAARDLFFTGNTVIIDHGLAMFSTLAHLSRIDVREGDAVVPGQVVGLVGATGRVTGAHLHWAVVVSGARVDPLSVLAVLGEHDGRRP